MANPYGFRYPDNDLRAKLAAKLLDEVPGVRIFEYNAGNDTPVSVHYRNDWPSTGEWKPVDLPAVKFVTVDVGNEQYVGFDTSPDIAPDELRYVAGLMDAAVRQKVDDGLTVYFPSLSMGLPPLTDAEIKRMTLRAKSSINSIARSLRNMREKGHPWKSRSTT